MTSRNSGFTLLEMLVVIAVMGISLLLLTGYLQPHSRTIEAQAAARQVAQAMRVAEDLAVTRRESVTLKMPIMPAWLTVSVESPPGGITFLPDGSASGGRVLLGFGHKTIAISVDWLTGRISVDGT
jgi:general secretion pathway protein H